MLQDLYPALPCRRWACDETAPLGGRGDSLGTFGHHLALPKGLLPSKSLHLPSSPACHLGLCLIAVPACLGVLKSGIPGGRDGEQTPCSGRDRTGCLGAGCLGAWLGEALCRPGAQLLCCSPPATSCCPGPSPGTRVTAVCEVRLSACP